MASLQLEVAGFKDARASCGSTVIFLSLSDMGHARIATNQLVQVGRPDDSAQPKSLATQLAESLYVSLRSDPEDKAGSKVAIAAAWPGPLLARGVAQLSTELYDQLGRPTDGESVLVIDQACEAVQATDVYVRLLRNVETTRIACLPSGQATAKGAASERRPASSRKSAPSRSTAAAPAASSTSSSRRRSASTASEPKGKPASKTASNEPPTTTLSGTSLEWLLATVQSSAPEDPQRTLLAALAAHHWHERCFLPGNIVILPLLGRKVLLEVLPHSHHSESEAADQSPSEAPAPLRVLRTRFGKTTFHLLGPDDEPPPPPDPNAGPDTAADSLAELLRKGEAAARASCAEGSDAGDTAAAAAVRAVRAGAVAGAASASLRDLGGVEEAAEALRELVTLPLKQPELFARFGLQLPKGVLLHGPPGTGKSTLARAAAADAGATLLVVNGPELLSEVLGESESTLAGLFAAARALAPSLIFFDEIDALAPARRGMAAGGGGGSSSDVATRVVSTLLTQMDGMGQHSEAPVIVLAATNRSNSLDMALRRPGRFDRELEIGVPSPAARTGILRGLLARMATSLSEDDIDRVASSLHGFVAADIVALCSEAGMWVLRKYARATDSKPPLVIDHEAIQHAMTVVKPSALREVALEVPKVSWDDVGGLPEIKNMLKEAIRLFETSVDRAPVGIKAPRGILLYGPPGCSKTMLARALASEAKMNFLSVKGSELYSKFVGESEKAVARLFARARQAAPSIIFFDEIDGLVVARGRSGQSAGVRERVLSQLLTEMDGLQSRARVLVVGATNLPGHLDAALLRPGRFDRLVYVPVPDEKSRQAILTVLLRSGKPGADVSIQELAARTPDFTGADLRALCREAALRALSEDMQASCVKRAHFMDALQHMSASPPVEQAVADTYRSLQRGLLAR